MPVKRKKAPVKAKAKKVKKPVKSAVKKKPAKKPAKKVVKKIVAPKRKVKAAKKPIRKLTKKVSLKKMAKKPAPSAKEAKKREKPIKTNVMEITEFVKKQVKKASKEPMTEVKPKPKAKPIKPAEQGETLGMVGMRPYEQQPGEEYMSEPQREHFRHILNQWKQELMQEVDRTVHHMQDEAANFPDPNDRATQEEEFSLELRTRDRERKLIKKIEESLEKLDRNEYGYCESCGVEIGVRRLEARPTATLCIDCKTLDEIKERQTGNV